MFLFRRALPVVLILALGLMLASCQEDTSGKNSEQAIFGSNGQDISEVIALVGDITITQSDLDFHFDELLPRLQKKYTGGGGQEMLLKDMIDQTLLVLGAREMGLQNREDVARTLISQQRTTMVDAMNNIGVIEGNEPTETDFRAFFNDNRKEFKQVAMIRVRHVECMTEEDANTVYELISKNTSGYNFMKVAAEYSVNKASLASNCDLGWFNRNGIVPLVERGNEFIKLSFDMPKGLNKPIFVVDRWHVVEVTERMEERMMTFNEALSLVKNAMMPGYYDGLIKDYLLSARDTYAVSRYGKYTPGEGLTPDLIMARASQADDPGVKIDYYRMLYIDYPDSERADDALFMCAMICLDNYHDRRLADRYLKIMIKEYPESEMYDDALFLKENLYIPEAFSPTSIEQLRGK